jgi:hypothetical protein
MKTALIAVLFAAVFVSAQTVTFGDNDQNACDAIRVKANLHVPSPLKLKGRIIDETGAAFANSAVELRTLDSDTKQTTIAKVSNDSEGRFDLGKIKKGDYRLLASPTRAFRQPEETWCRADAECVLEITLHANPTDLPDSQCPIN